MKIFIFLMGAVSLFCETISTFYGPFEVEEPVILEIIHAPIFQRLKEIHQYGVSYYTKTHTEEYNRFDHSLGVFAILRKKGASLEEQIAGLLHDASHTVFSHVGDWVFQKMQQETDYQSSIHPFFLAASGIEKILNKYGFTLDQVSPKREGFHMLEQPLPHLCADRIDYNIQGAYHQHFITKEEALALFEDLVFEEGKWILKNQTLAAKLAHFSLFMTRDCWGNAINGASSEWLAEALVQALQSGLISWHTLHFGTDQEVWDLLIKSPDPLIREKMALLEKPDQYCKIVLPTQADRFIPFKCRGIDPLIQQEENSCPLSQLDPFFKQAFYELKTLAQEGWPVQIEDHPVSD